MSEVNKRKNKRTTWSETPSITIAEFMLIHKIENTI